MPEGVQRLNGTNEGQDNGEALALVGVRLVAQLGDGFLALVLQFTVNLASMG